MDSIKVIGTYEFWCFITNMPIGLAAYSTNEDMDAKFLIENDHTPFDNIYADEDNSFHVDESDPETGNNIEAIINQQIMWNEMFLQNRIITNERDFDANKSITAGKNVRNFSEQYNGETGDFVVNSGKLTFSADEVILEAGFEVKKGAEFEIK